MMKNYFSRAALLLGAAAFIGTSVANAEETKGAWRNVNHLLTNVSGIEGWYGNATGIFDKVGEIFYGAGLFYYVVPDAPAGQYTLTAQAFNRVTSAPEAYQLREAGKEEINCYLFVDDAEAKVKSLFDATEENLWGDDGYIWGIVPNSLSDARTFFDAKKYTATVTTNHPGGDLFIGVRNYGSVGIDEWTAFGDFELTGPNGAVTLPAFPANVPYEENGETKYKSPFELTKDWEANNVDGSIKGRGLQNGGVWSKTNASPYNEAQTLTVDPGKYRFVIQSFNQDFLGSYNSYCVPMKGEFADRTDLKSAKDLWDEKAETLGSGAVRGSDPWNPTTFFKMEALKAYVSIYYGPFRQGGFDTTDKDKLFNYWMEGDWEDKAGTKFNALEEGQWDQAVIKNIFDEETDFFASCENYKDEDGDWVYTNAAGDPIWWESGANFEAAAQFVANPDLYLNIVELEVTGTEPQEITVSYRKDINQNNYWNPVFNVRLEKWDDNYTGYQQNAGIDSVVVDENANAPVEYYNLQGVRVQNPANGLYIVKQGNKVVKQVIR
ncbi:MAG: hypothetical protein K2I64_01135 [Muribaculaceae bacterium]|nr:hypothetical protein [Muribaculaceae bacterium]